MLQQVEAPLLTCEAVLAETPFHFQSTNLALRTVTLGLVELTFKCSEHLAELAGLAEHYSDRKPDLADLCLIRMRELHPRHVLLTVDEKGFRVYRRNKRDHRSSPLRIFASGLNIHCFSPSFCSG